MLSRIISWVDYNPQKTRISTARLGDLGNTVSNDWEYAKDGFPIGTPIFRSPEAALRIPWGCSTDIWSLRTTVRSCGNLKLLPS